MSKGAHTRDTILRQALDLSSEVGLEGLTLGSLAKRVGMSKSGLYAHFKSKEELQSQVLDKAAELFVHVVLTPALKQPRGLQRVQSLFEHWLVWGTDELSGGCPFVAAAIEFDDRAGLLRDRLVSHLRDIMGTIAQSARICIEEGHFRSDLDVDQFAFELWAILLSYQLYSRLMLHEDARTKASRAFESLINNAQGA